MANIRYIYTGKNGKLITYVEDLSSTTKTQLVQLETTKQAFFDKMESENIKYDEKEKIIEHFKNQIDAKKNKQGIKK